MKAAQMRALIGKKIEWEYAHDRGRGTCLVATGIVKDVKGRNVLVDQQGSYDWKWLPQMANVKEMPDE